MKTQYRKNMRLKPLDVFKTKKQKTQSEMMEDIIVINRESCTFCTLGLFSLTFALLTLYSFKFTTASNLDLKLIKMDKSLKKLENKILNMSNITQISKTKILPQTLQREFSAKCFKINEKNEQKEVIYNIDSKFSDQYSKVENVHFASFSKLELEIDDLNLKNLGYNLTRYKDDKGVNMVKVEAPSVKILNNLEICVLVSGKLKT